MTFTGECWRWTANYNPNGYGQLWSPALGRTTQAHRFVYESLVGPIPKGLQLDHLCRVRGCVNPGHLRVVTGRMNTLAPGSKSIAAFNAAKKHCLVGHAFDKTNTVTDSKGGRGCLTCTRRRNRLAVRRYSAHGAIPSHDAACSSGVKEAVTTGPSSSTAKRVGLPETRRGDAHEEQLNGGKHSRHA